MLRTKFHSEAETACGVRKSALLATYSAYFTSVASEISAQKGQKGINVCAQKFHSEAETACGVRKSALLATYSAIARL